MGPEMGLALELDLGRDLVLHGIATWDWDWDWD